MRGNFSFSLIWNIVVWIIISWVLIHLFAIFGVFIALAYPLLWLLQPKRTTCFVCQMKQDGEQCGLCRHKVDRKRGIFPSNFRSIALNSGLLFSFSILSFGLVFFESRLLGRFGFSRATKTASFVIPAKSQYRIGQVFTLHIDVHNIDNPINAIQADVSFDPAFLEVIDVSTAESFADIFIQKEIDNQVGWVRLAGGVTNPGFYGERGVFGTILFRAKAAGATQVAYLDSSLVLANDGSGSNILKDLPSIPYLIIPEKVSPEEEALQRERVMQFGAEQQSSLSTRRQLAFYEQGTVLGAQSADQAATADNNSQSSFVHWFQECLRD